MMMNKLVWTTVVVVVCAAAACSADDISNNQIVQSAEQPQRTFRVDYDNNQFLKDGQPFRFIAGSLHYFRALPETWQTKLRTLRASGLNAVTTYVEWSLHNPHDGQYEWTGMADLVRFIELAAEEKLLVILRPGPYICAERDMGGFPYWLLHKYPNIKLRTNDNDYLNETTIWYDQLMPQLHGLLYENGGPIIMVQVENEYGSFACDADFRLRMKQLTERHVRGAAVLFTNDGPSQTRCGKIDGVLATLDFGAGSAESTNNSWMQLRRYQPNGPLVNTEYYPGWLTHWQEKLATVDTNTILKTLRNMLNNNASVNFYMFYGGTNFGFTAGANLQGAGGYAADITSYDYDAPMDEAGDPTSKYYAIRKVIGEYLPLPDIPIPTALPKMGLDDVTLQPVVGMLSRRGRHALGAFVKEANQPMSFEALNQYSGFVLYETKLPKLSSDPALLVVKDLHDRATVYIDHQLVGILSRESQVDSLPIHAGSTLQILVENQGRINFILMEDFKGILGIVTLNGRTLSNWTHTGFPLTNYSAIENLMLDESKRSDVPVNRAGYLLEGPHIFHGQFIIEDDWDIYDTYFDPRGWGKGIVFINGFNLGRYWPVIGPQITLYVPKEILHHGKNHIVTIELQLKSGNGSVGLVDTPNLNGF